MTKNENEVNNTSKHNGSVEIQVYTDPLCCWSWGFEPQWRRLRYEYGSQVKWRYRMAGLIPDWSSYTDPMNSVSRPVQMGPMWLEVHHLSGMPLQDKIWFTDPPASSYPACMAVKSAGLQSPAAEEMYLRRVREAVMLQGRNIAKREVLLDVAKELSESKPELLDYTAFERELTGQVARKAFEEDLQQVRYHLIGRYPTLTISKPGQTGVMIVGYRPYDALVTALGQAAPELQPVQQATDAESYRRFWAGATDREVQEALGQEATSSSAAKA
ncbi:DsbA family protein [Pontibacter sp. 172403-2]|uniref:DsbA family oxidoreductase n=1 Tax=Pontibacter rufus TaxID=2791028 RepID=UPI0018AFAA2E|nr:DsbA family protein [Pontibacter sp. 172403-2]MBF9254582.1 DsbA family protein [Pontibacter sp. 172403-2]